MKRISKIMREYGIKVNGIKKFKASSASSKPPQNVKENILKQNFKAERKNQIWVTDITYIWTKDGWLYLSSILDLWSKKIIHYEIRNTMDKKLVIDTLEKAYLKEQPELETIIHSANGNMSPLNFEKKYEEKLSTILT